MQAGLFSPTVRFEPIVLRSYQHDAKEAVYEHLRTRDDNPVVVIPTGGGKTPVIAQICRDAVTQWQGRVIVLAHVKELLTQSADKLRRICPGIPVGIYSAGLSRRDTSQKIIVAGIQSVYTRACELDPFDLAIVDEAHLIPPEGDGMYRQFLADAKAVNPNLRIIGLTATPFRLKSGQICTPDGFLNHVCYEIGVRQLIVDGYLSPLVTKAGKVRAKLDQIHVRGGEFIAQEMETVMDDVDLVKSACREIVEFTRDRKGVLIFAAGVKHGMHVVCTLQELGCECGFITGDTPDRQRAETLDDFQSGKLKYLANVNVLTTGFDATHIDCVVLLRPTMSAGLYYQMVGRGFRLHPGKADCLVLDYGGNVLRHGPVDQLSIENAGGSNAGAPAPAKECPQCQAIIACGYSTCPSCGYEFPQPDRQKHDAEATNAGILSGQITRETFEVRNIYYGVHVKRGFDSRTMRVDYVVGPGIVKSEWVCVEHEGYARRKAEIWWTARSQDPVPNTVEDAVAIAEAGGLATCSEITVQTVAGEKFERIVDYKLGEIPPPSGLEPGQAMPSLSSTYPEDDIPF